MDKKIVCATSTGQNETDGGGNSLQKQQKSNEGNKLPIEKLALAGGVATVGYLLYKGAAYIVNQSNNSNAQQSQEIIGPDPSDDSSGDTTNDDESGNNLGRNEKEEGNSNNNGKVLEVSEDDEHDGDDDEEVNSPFMCPITLQIMEDPVITPHGITYERQAILDWIEKKRTCPITQKPLGAEELITCYALKSAIEDYKKMREDKSLPRVRSSSSSKKTKSQNDDENNSNINKKAPFTIEVSENIRNLVQIWRSSKICSVDSCADYPEGSKYIIFPPSVNYVVSKSTGYICIENRGDYDVTLVSRERAPTALELFNVGARVAGSFVLKPHTRQGFDFRGYYCIQVRQKSFDKPVDLLVYDFAFRGGGKGNWLKMA